MFLCSAITRTSLSDPSVWPGDGRAAGPGPECPVCWNPFSNTFHTPKVLDCCHSFCVECLAHQPGDSDAPPAVPAVRHPTVLASDSLSLTCPRMLPVLTPAPPGAPPSSWKAISSASRTSQSRYACASPGSTRWTWA